MSAGAYVGGVVWFAAIWGASLAAAAIVHRRRLGHLRGAPAVLAYALLATLALIAAHVVPAALTVLGRGSVLATAVALLGAALLVPRAPAGDATAAPPAVWADPREGTPSR